MELPKGPSEMSILRLRRHAISDVVIAMAAAAWGPYLMGGHSVKRVSKLVSNCLNWSMACRKLQSQAERLDLLYANLKMRCRGQAKRRLSCACCQA